MSTKKEISKQAKDILNEGSMALVMTYARQYQENPKNWIQCYLKFQSIRSACKMIVKTFKDSGVFEDCKKCGKDFSEYANKQKLELKWKNVLSEILLIMYSIIHDQE